MKFVHAARSPWKSPCFPHTNGSGAAHGTYVLVAVDDCVLDGVLVPVRVAVTVAVVNAVADAVEMGVAVGVLEAVVKAVIVRVDVIRQVDACTAGARYSTDGAAARSDDRRSELRGHDERERRRRHLDARSSTPPRARCSQSRTKSQRQQFPASSPQLC